MEEKKQTLQQKIQELEEKLSIYEENPVLLSSYNACKVTVENYNQQLTDNKIDLLNVEDKPKFEMAHKYMTEMILYLNNIEKIRTMMSPAIAKKLDNQLKNDKASLKDKSLAL